MVDTGEIHRAPFQNRITTLEAQLEAKDRELVQHEESICDWKCASGLERGGDPDGVRPEDLEQSIAERDLELAQLRARVGELEKGFDECIRELESSGYCFDHPSLVRYQSILTTPPKEPNDG